MTRYEVILALDMREDHDHTVDFILELLADCKKHLFEDEAVRLVDISSAAVLRHH